MSAPDTRTRRIGRGTGHSYHLDGEPVMGVTTILKVGMPKPALIGWAARCVAEAVVNRRDCLQDFTDDEITDFLRGAPNRMRDPAANRGTTVHKLASAIAHGEDVAVSRDLLPYVDQYIAFLNAFEPAAALIERPVFNRTQRYGGTLDMLAVLNGPAGGRRTLVDIKTSGSGIYGEVALQLVGYGRAEFYLDAQGREMPLPEVEAYAALWIRPDGYTLYPIEVTETEWTIFQNVHRVAWWIQNRQQLVRKDPTWERQHVALEVM